MVFTHEAVIDPRTTTQSPDRLQIDRGIMEHYRGMLKNPQINAKAAAGLWANVQVFFHTDNNHNWSHWLQLTRFIH
jgi:hypothetical protein